MIKLLSEQAKSPKMITGSHFIKLKWLVKKNQIDLNANFFFKKSINFSVKMF